MAPCRSTVTSILPVMAAATIVVHRTGVTEAFIGHPTRFLSCHDPTARSLLPQGDSRDGGRCALRPRSSTLASSTDRGEECLNESPTLANGVTSVAIPGGKGGEEAVQVQGKDVARKNSTRSTVGGVNEGHGEERYR
ncbi:unnamed protein product, partial [Discosporangium mesarthrocarpum]